MYLLLFNKSIFIPKISKLKNLQPPNVVRYKATLVGAQNSGKTAFAKCASSGQPTTSTQQTLGIDQFEITRQIDEMNYIKLNLFDTSGDPQYQELRSEFYADMNALMFFCDCQKRDQLTELAEFFDECTKFGNQQVQDIVTCLIVTFKDRDQKINDSDFNIFCQRIKTQLIFKVSNKTGDGVQDCVEKIINELQKRVKK